MFGKPFITSWVFRSTKPSLPKRGLGMPVRAFSEISSPSSVPNRICGGVRSSPAQYASPRIEPPVQCNWCSGEFQSPGAVYSQISSPVSGSSATTR